MPIFRFDVYIWNTHLRTQTQVDTPPLRLTQLWSQTANFYLALAKQCLFIYKQMQAIDWMKDRTKTQATQIIPTSVFIRYILQLYQKPVINTGANILFLCLSSSIMEIMTITPHYLDEQQASLMKENRCLGYKKKCHIAYDYPRNREVIAISKDVNKNSDS